MKAAWLNKTLDFADQYIGSNARWVDWESKGLIYWPVRDNVSELLVQPIVMQAHDEIEAT